ncbi:cell death specification protein 2 [Loa loa]|uniref:Cell death specification protein 2 n=1 Tax=Loa loa TaxID=7209 RepID=A0A1I7VCA9_LOALO|nr:cell death specification protein 2 [Loa loa]EFO17475.1 cell death specification protein 2 [Loa loa]
MNKKKNDEKAKKIDFMAFEQKELRRIRNNDAARKSRQARRDKEAKNRIRMAALEQENGALRAQIDVLKKELEHVHLVILATNVTWKTLLRNQF